MNCSGRASCVLIGNTSMVIECAEQLLRRNVEIKAVITGDNLLSTWAFECGIRCFTTIDELDDLVSIEPCSWLFSIINPILLPLSLIEKFLHGVFNYHDALLPRYAGSYSTAWAVLNGEKQHGITWHRVDEVIDRGDIAVRIVVNEVKDDTTFSLNLKCFQAAIEGFSILLDKLLNNTLELIAQNKAERTYYAKDFKPVSCGFLLWNLKAKELSALVRSMNFGEDNYNPITTPKMLLNNDIVYISELLVTTQLSLCSPGTVLNINESGMVVATSDYDVIINNFRDNFGNKLSASEFFPEIGNVLLLPDIQDLKELNKLLREFSASEEFWIEKLINFNRLDFPLLGKNIDLYKAKYSTSDWNNTDFLNEFNFQDKINLIVSSIIVYLYRMSGQHDIQLGIINDCSVASQDIFLSKIVSSIIPVNLTINENFCFFDVMKKFNEGISDLLEKGSFPYDIFIRKPELNPIHWGVIIQYVTNHSLSINSYHDDLCTGLNESIIKGGCLIFQINTDTGEFRYLYDDIFLYKKNYMCDSILLILNTIVEKENLFQSINKIDFMVVEERKLLLENWNHVEEYYPNNLCLHQLFEEQVIRYPTAIALVHGEIELTYDTLNRRANQLAHRLIQMGVTPDSLVALCVERSPAMIISLLGILKAGGAYLPMELGSPQQRLCQQLMDASPILLLTDKVGHRRLERYKPEELPELEFSVMENEEGNFSEDNPDPYITKVCEKHLAYVIYTSGSTGKPKGVMVEHDQIVNIVHWHIFRFRLGLGSRSAMTTSLSFDASAGDIWPALSCGGTLVLAPSQLANNVPVLLEWLNNQALDITFLVSPIATLAIEEGKLNHHLRYLLIGGDRFTFPLISLPSQLTLINSYGPTETTVLVTSGELGHNDHVVHIGRPVANARIYLLNEYREPVPLGCVGEIYIGGVGVARGYLKNIKLTIERFMVDPFSPILGARMYRSGDLARYLPDGRIEYVGRNDQQIKLRGYRIELGEIEKRLNQHSDISDSVVVLREDIVGDKRLVAYFIPIKEQKKMGKNLLNRMLRNFLSQTLPDYMLPSAYVLLESFPLTSNGKINRQALPKPDIEAVRFITFEEPKGEVEQRLSLLWSELLDVAQIGRQEDFFEIGGHSLLAVRLLNRINQLFCISSTLERLYKHRTLADQADMLVKLQGQEDVLVKLPPVVRFPRVNKLPLSASQRRLWFLMQMDPKEYSYNVPLLLEICSWVNIEALRITLGKLFERHEVLRATFSVENGEPYIQLLPADSCIPFTESNLSDQRNISKQRLNKLFQFEACQLFDMDQGPLFRGHLYRMDSEENYLLLTFHHIIFDGWSVNILLNELNILYQAECNGLEAQLPELDIQYIDYALWQSQWLTDEYLKMYAMYWQEKLSGVIPLLPLPIDKPRVEQQNFMGSALPIEVGALLSLQLKQLSQCYETTLSTTLLSAIAIVLARLSGLDDVIVAIPVANRGRYELEPLIGFFVNTLVLRIDLSDEPDGATLLARVKQTVLEAQDNQELPFEKVVEIVNPPRSMAYTPLYQVMFSWEENVKHEFPGFRVHTKEIFLNRVKTDLEFIFSENEHGIITGQIRYACAVFDVDTIERFRIYLLSILQSMVEGIYLPVFTYNMIGDEERKLLLETWNQAEKCYPNNLCLHQLFEDQVIRHPDAIALVYNETVLTYETLNRQSNQLAHCLIEMGVIPDSLVALCIKRSPAMVICLLAVLKAGGAYLPLDPGSPAQRLFQQLEDASPILLLTDKVGHRRLEGYKPNELPELELFTWQDKWDNFSEDNPDPNVTRVCEKHLAYVIYTSGSTGKPKGVMVEHVQVVRLFQSTDSIYKFNEKDIWCLFHSYAFDFSVWEIWGALLYGGKLVIVPEQSVKDTKEFYELVCRKRITILNQTPSAFELFIDEQGKRRLPNDLRYVIFGGEELSPSMLSGWYFEPSSPKTQFVNMYGITEITVHATYHIIQMSDIKSSCKLIGKRLKDLCIYILDTYLRPVPTGVKGEIYIAGPGVARGYLNRPRLTQERFIRNPFSSTDEIMYRTGDIACYLNDGNIEYLGRNDRQIQLRGFRIELKEIEAIITALEGVLKSVVVIRGEGDNKYLSAYLVCSNVYVWSKIKIKEKLSYTLPEYMVPTTYTFLDSIPLTINGKVNYSLLPEPDRNDECSYVAPSNILEVKICQLLSQHLKLERVGIFDDFFQLGGNSILAVRLVAAMNDSLNIAVELSDIFLGRNVFGIAKMLQNRGKSEDRIPKIFLRNKNNKGGLVI
ncbi:amino acid adenylation domain-containing protein [Photorhabdus khanii]|uniref:Amino acid adenylation domain-containing protein n=1 Tax=Photorhabdus khanii TaxID=1004150 RepID=A0A7C9GM69_9GAMM|nr:amino acid adenylation domain-containing protein [Photorhabdus khanii]